MAKKRANGEGTMRKTGKSWEIRVMDGYKPDGKPRIYMFRGKTQSEARAKFAEYKRQKAAGVVWEQYSFTDWADLWYASHKDNVSATTAEGYKYTLRIMKAHFGEKKISEIRAIHIEDYLRKLREEGRADASISKHRGMLYQIFRKAEASDLVRKNPVAFSFGPPVQPPYLSASGMGQPCVLSHASSAAREAAISSSPWILPGQSSWANCPYLSTNGRNFRAESTFCFTPIPAAVMRRTQKPLGSPSFIRKMWSERTRRRSNVDPSPTAFG